MKRLPPLSRLSSPSRSPWPLSFSSRLQCTPPTFSRSFFTSTPRSLRYHPLPRSHSSRRHFFGFLDEIPQNTIFYGIIGLNATVFAMWFMSTQKYVCRIPILITHQTNEFHRNKNTIPRRSYGCTRTLPTLGRIFHPVGCQSYSHPGIHPP